MFRAYHVRTPYLIDHMHRAPTYEATVPVRQRRLELEFADCYFFFCCCCCACWRSASSKASRIRLASSTSSSLYIFRPYDAIKFEYLPQLFFTIAFLDCSPEVDELA